ncbi:hypothetical protein RF11_07913 [Thelohanellus kitauei]|uniref:Uncharacterized protein n=1 Tax=Thelohanellus kitauei TaxID=669202 RepID=A0A0C2J2C4_THEKT|nr:hypothetical protein RF11_07913 [Thelohanellus kitauei]
MQRFFKLIHISKSFFDAITAPKVDEKTAATQIRMISTLPHHIIAYFAISLTVSYPNSPMIKYFLLYLKGSPLPPDVFNSLVEVICSTGNYNVAIETSLISNDYFAENDEMRLKFIKYYIINHEIPQALELATFLHYNIPIHHYDLISAFISMITDQDQVIPYFLLFYQRFAFERRLNGLVASILTMLFDKFRDLTHEQDSINFSLCLMSLFLYLQHNGILFSQQKFSQPTAVILTGSKCICGLYNYSICKNIFCAFDVVFRHDLKDNESTHFPVLQEIKFLQISTAIQFGLFDEAFCVLCELINHYNNKITQTNAFWNLFFFLVTNAENIDRRRVIRTLKELKTAHRFESDLAFGCLSKCSTKNQPVIKKSFRACVESVGTSLPYLVHSVNLFNVSISKPVKDGTNAVFQSLIFLMVYYHQLIKDGLSGQASYNLGRLFHGYGFLDMAESFYRKALQSSDSSFRREAAYNLALIYENSNNRALACSILRNHFTV